MSEPFKFEPANRDENSQEEDASPQKESPQKKESHLKLVVSNPPLVQKKKPFQAANLNKGFSAEIHQISDCQYTLIAYDPFHRLDCEIALNIHDDEDMEPGSVVCRFPNILGEELNDFIGEDETLYGMILIQFQMKLLEQILLFCSAHDALNLLIFVENGSEGDALGVYRNFVVYEDKVPTLTGIKTHMVIPATPNTFDKVIDFMDEVNQDFRQMLWRDQRTNPSIRAYLKLNPSLKFFR